MTPPDFSGDFPEGMIPSDFSGDFPQGMIPSDFSGDFPQGVIPSDFDVNNFFGIGKSESSSSATSSISKMLSSDTAIASSEDAEINSATPSDSDNSNPFNGSIPEGFTPPTGENGEFEIPSDFSDIFNGGFGGGFGGMNSSDVKLQYIDDNVNSYSNIFENAKTDITTADKNRLIDSLKNLGNGENLEAAVDIDAVIRYFVVHNFVVNSDSYTGSMIHNYYLYEKDGQMQMIPWDYNLAFGSFMSMGSATSSVNDPIDTPLSVSGSGDRPMIDWIFSNEEYTELYHQYFNEFIELYFGNGYFEEMINNVKTMISPYVEKDPTKFCTYEEFEAGVSTLESFCLLRAESVKGQLNGTIGTTTDTQKSETLIDASDIDVSSMGTMGSMGGMGSGMSFPGDNMQIPTVDPADGTANTPPTENDNGNASEQQMPDFFSGDFNGMTPPQGENASTEIDRSKIQPQNTLPLSSLIMIGVSVIVLALGTLIAFKYKRRKR